MCVIEKQTVTEKEREMKLEFPICPAPYWKQQEMDTCNVFYAKKEQQPQVEFKIDRAIPLFMPIDFLLVPLILEFSGHKTSVQCQQDLTLALKCKVFRIIIHWRNNYQHRIGKIIYILDEKERKYMHAEKQLNSFSLADLVFFFGCLQDSKWI